MRIFFMRISVVALLMAGYLAVSSEFLSAPDASGYELAHLPPQHSPLI